MKGARGVWEELKGIWCSIGWGLGWFQAVYEEGAGKSVIRLAQWVKVDEHISSFRQLIKHHCMYIAEALGMNEN